MKAPLDIVSDDEDQNLWLLLVQTRDVLQNARQKELSKYHLSVGQASMIYAISSIGGDVIPARLAPWVFRKPNTVSDIIKRMAKDGLVISRKDRKRKNVIHVSLTKKAKDLYKLASKRESIHRIMSSLSQEEMRQLESTLKKMRYAAFKELETE